jgi:hypothetical protein
VLATEPRFKIQITSGAGELRGIHPDSPAGLYFKRSFDFYKNFNVQFVDIPFSGGLGASTAQFLGLFAFYQWQKNGLETERVLDHRDLLNTYIECAWSGQGARPSGADLMAQERGFVTFFAPTSGQLNRHSWMFPHLDFHLFHTGQKVATHLHLQALKDFSAKSLQVAFADIYSGFLSSDEDVFLKGIEAYALALENENLTADYSLQCLRKIRLLPGVRAAKACGALGADVLLVITAKNTDQDLFKFCQTQNLLRIASSASISEGLQLEVLDEEALCKL